jgi:putative transposase
MVIFATFRTLNYTANMNTRDYKMFYSGGYYHIYNRGDNKEAVFIDEQDYLNFLKRLKIILGLMAIPNAGGRNALRLKSLPPKAFTILCYCLMPNHFHFLIRQNTELSIGRLITGVCTSYAKYFNAKYERIGNLYQDTFKAKHVENDNYLTTLSAYIHTNPSNPFHYSYSSLPDYAGLRNGTICDTGFLLGCFNNDRESYKKFVMDYSEKEAAQIAHLMFEEN